MSIWHVVFWLIWTTVVCCMCSVYLSITISIFLQVGIVGDTIKAFARAILMICLGISVIFESFVVLGIGMIACLGLDAISSELDNNS